MVEDNDISENKRAGIAILTGGDPVVRQNKIHNGHDSGVLVSEKGRGRIEQNDIFCNMRAGVARRLDSRGLKSLPKASAKLIKKSNVSNSISSTK